MAGCAGEVKHPLLLITFRCCGRSGSSAGRAAPPCSSWFQPGVDLAQHEPCDAGKVEALRIVQRNPLKIGQFSTIHRRPLIYQGFFGFSHEETSIKTAWPIGWRDGPANKCQR